MSFKFKVGQKVPGSLARAGVISTPHGNIHTPAFIVVGTKATVKALAPEQVKDLGAQAVLANTYHLYLQPGDETVRDAGGIHRFMNWSGPIFTDSGGFQAFSLGAGFNREISKIGTKIIAKPETSEDVGDVMATVTEDGVKFKSYIDGSEHFFTPERSMEIQYNLGADIIFAFDECTSPNASDAYQKEALRRTHAWAKRSLEHHQKLKSEARNQKSEANSNPKELQAISDFDIRHSNLQQQALFGVVQGGRRELLRKESATVLAAMDFDGYGIGGSFDKEDMGTAVRWVNEILPEDKPRHLLGIGEPIDIILGIENGIDTFDCVIPTRMGRNGTIMVEGGRINIMNSEFRNDFQPIEEGCGCYTCTNYTRAYLAHLFRAKEMLAATLASIHNTHFLVSFVERIRRSVLHGTFPELKEELVRIYNK